MGRFEEWLKKKMDGDAGGEVAEPVDLNNPAEEENDEENQKTTHHHLWYGWYSKRKDCKYGRKKDGKCRKRPH